MHATLDDRLPAASFGAVARTSQAAVITGRALSGLAIAFLLFDALAKVFLLQPVVDGAEMLGPSHGTSASRKSRPASARVDTWRCVRRHPRQRSSERCRLSSSVTWMR